MNAPVACGSSPLSTSLAPRALPRARSARSPMKNGLRASVSARRSSVVIVKALSSPSSTPKNNGDNNNKPRGESGLDVNGSRPTSPKAWEEIKRTLKEANATFLSPQEVVFARDRGRKGGGGGVGVLPSLLSEPLQALAGYLSGSDSESSGGRSSKKGGSSSSSSSAGGALLLDIRPPNEYQKGCIPGSVSVPLYRPITGLSPRAVARRAVFAFFGVLNGTEANPNFVEEVIEVLERASSPNRIITICNVGGAFSSETNTRGTQSRSMSAAYELVRAGVAGGSSGVKIDMLKGGFNEWIKSEREVVVPEK